LARSNPRGGCSGRDPSATAIEAAVALGPARPGPGLARGRLHRRRALARPIEPRNFVRPFRRICDGNKIRLIKVHHIPGHTVGSLLKDLGVPARDAQTILGHTRISTTLEI
jgi:integrase